MYITSKSIINTKVLHDLHSFTKREYHFLYTDVLIYPRTVYEKSYRTMSLIQNGDSEIVL